MRSVAPVVIAVVGVAIVLALVLVFWRPDPQVALYCSQDEVFARDLLQAFSRQSGLATRVKFDTEANKSVGLYAEIVQDRSRPRADVFWNNEILGSIRLESQDLLAPCPSPFDADDVPIPATAISKTGSWIAIGTRARVVLVNTNLVSPADMPASLLDLTQPRYRGRVAMAMPHHGTSATQAACLFEVLGDDRAMEYYRELKANGVQLASGNKKVAEWVGSGKVDIGVTDNDDALEEIRAKRPVRMLFPDGEGEPRVAGMGTLFIPNTLCVLKNGPNAGAGAKLVEYLTSAEVETKLAQGDSGQIPVRKALRDQVPEAMLPALKVREMAVDFYRAAGRWDAVQTFLRNEFAR